MRALRLSPAAYRLINQVLLVVATLILALAYLPLMWWFAFVWTAVRAWAHLGYWPGYGGPCPVGLPLDYGPIPQWTEGAVPLLFLGVCIALTMLAMRRRVRKRWWIWTVVLVWFVAWPTAVGLVAVDPGDAVYCFLD